METKRFEEDRISKRIIQELSAKYSIPPIKVRIAFEYQFKFLADTIRAGKFESVRLKYLGVFHVKPGRKHKIDKAFEIHRERLRLKNESDKEHTSGIQQLDISK